MTPQRPEEGNNSERTAVQAAPRWGVLSVAPSGHQHTAPCAWKSVGFVLGPPQGSGLPSRTSDTAPRAAPATETSRRLGLLPPSPDSTAHKRSVLGRRAAGSPGSPEADAGCRDGFSFSARAQVPLTPRDSSLVAVSYGALLPRPDLPSVGEAAHPPFPQVRWDTAASRDDVQAEE